MNRRRLRLSAEDAMHRQNEVDNSSAPTVCGSISRIVLKNVFCHEHLDFDGFRNNINLFQGPNGSGKSSIVAAIIAGLGGTSKATDRTKNMKGLIQSGKNWASIEIYLKNDGLLAYKSNEYGDHIVIERRILMSGTSSYKIKSAAGAVVSTKKDELNKILDWFNLQVDNPALILSQERAKTFLSATTPSSMFNFYYSATSLRHFSNSIESLKADIASMNRYIERKEENIPSIKREVKDWQDKVEAVKNLEEKRKNLSFLKKAKAWAEVSEMENHLENLIGRRDKVTKALSDLQEKMAGVESFIKGKEDEGSGSEKSMVVLSKKCKEVEASREEANAELTQAKKALRDCINKESSMKQRVEEKATDVQILTNKLREGEPSDAIKAQWQSAMEKLAAEKNGLSEERKAIDNCMKTLKAHQANLSESLNEARQLKDHRQAEENTISHKLGNLKREQGNLQGQKENISVFGQSMPRILQEIDFAASRNMFRIKPIGPIGAHIKVKQNEWVHIVEMVTKNMLSSFICFSKEDYQQLERIFNKVLRQGERRPQIIKTTFKHAVHDVRRFEVKTEQYSSLWSAIEVADVQVANALIDMLQLESTLLVPTALEANNLLIEASKVPANCKKAITLNGDKYFPDPNFKVYSGTGDKTVRFLQVSVEDRVRDLEKNIENMTRHLDECKKVKATERKSYEQIIVEDRKNEGKINALERELSQLKRKFSDLNKREQDLKLEEPVVLDDNQLKKDLKEAEEAKAEVDKETEECRAKVNEARREVEQKTKTLKDAVLKVQQIKESFDHFQEQRRELCSLVGQKQKILNAYRVNKEELLTRMTENSRSAEEAEQELERKTGEAQELAPERIEQAKSSKELERSYVALEKAIKHQEAINGDVELLQRGFEMRREKYENIVHELSSEKNFVRKLVESLYERRSQFKSTKKIFENLFKTSFKNKVQERNLEARISFDYVNESLTIKMRKLSDNSNSDMLSIQMLSGGEKSFATVSFILALWEWISSPIRVMDEFDIFMDVVTRSQCVDIIVNSAKTDVQYILVSPLEYRKKSEKLHVFRLSAPRRQENEDEDS